MYYIPLYYQGPQQKGEVSLPKNILVILLNSCFLLLKIEVQCTHCIIMNRLRLQLRALFEEHF